MATGPENLTRWVKHRLEREIGARMPDLQKAVEAGFRRLRVQALDELDDAVKRGKAELAGVGENVVEKAKDLVDRAGDGAKDLFNKLGKFPKGRW